MTVQIDEYYGVQLNENQINAGYRNLVDVLKADIQKLTKENLDLRQSIKIYRDHNMTTIQGWKK